MGEKVQTEPQKELSEPVSISLKEVQRSITPKTSKKYLLVWASLLLLTITLILPLVGEAIQKTYIGNEEYCCASFLIPEVVEKVEHAKGLHWLSNIIIGGSIFTSIIALAVVVVILYKYVIPRITEKTARNVLRIIISAVIVPVSLLILCIAAYFVFDNHGYYVNRAHAPDDGIYGDFFRKELFYLSNKHHV